MDADLIKHANRLEEIVHGIGQASSHDAKGDRSRIDELVGDGLATLVQLHEAHVRARKDTSYSLEELAAMKENYENGLLSLQNKRVEKMFYSRMISANNSFRSIYADADIALPTDGSLVHLAHAGDTLSDEAHNAAKAWLRNEADIRRKLSESKSDLERQHKALAEDNNSKRQKLSQAASHVTGVVSSCRPAFRYLNISALQSCDSSSMSQLQHLPAKLQALYYQFAAASVLATVPAQIEVEVERHSRKRKMRSQELQVRLTVFVGASKALIVFGFVPEMDVVTARFSDKDLQHQHMLSAIFPNDTGESWPGDQRPDASTTVHANARPYRWCQCFGVHTIDTSGASKLQSAIDFVSWFQARYTQISSLWDHLQSLQNKRWPLSKEKHQTKLCESVTITEWKLTQDVHLATLEHSQKDGAKEEGEVDEADKDTLQAQGTDLTIMHEGTIQLNGFDVAVRIRLKSSLLYPYKVPELRLANAHGSYFAKSLLADIEADVNCKAPLRDQDDPLPGQLACLVQHLAAEV